MRAANFHVLKTDDPKVRFCKIAELCESALSENKSVLIYSDLPALLERVNHWLWSFKAQSFLPHNRVGELPKTSVQLACGDELAEADILINLSEHVPDLHTQFAEIIEVVNQEPAVLQNSRRHYKFYQEEGWETAHISS